MTIRLARAVILICFLPFLISAKDNDKEPAKPKFITSHYYVVSQFGKEWTTKNLEIRQQKGVYSAEFIVNEVQKSRIITYTYKKTITLYGAFSVEEVEARHNNP